MSRLNVNSDKGETSQVLPQFRDTKLGNLRFGKQTSRKGGFDMQNDWRIVALFIVVNLAFLASGLILIYPLGQPIAGWVILGIWGLLTLCGFICLIIIFFRSRKGKRKRQEHLELGSRVSSSENIRKLPHDPVMNRAITMLVYHGQEDCEECRLLRHREDFQRRLKEWSVVGAPETFEHMKLPSSVSQGSRGYHNSQHSNVLHPNGAYENNGVRDPGEFQGYIAAGDDSHREMYRMDDGNMYSDESLEDECFYNLNQNNNNKSNEIRVTNGPLMIVTPPDTQPPRDDDELRRDSNGQTPIGSTKSDVIGPQHASYKSDSTEIGHEEGKLRWTNGAVHGATSKTHNGLTGSKPPLTNYDVGNDSNPRDPRLPKTRKYHKVGRKVPVSKEHAAISRRRRKNAVTSPTNRNRRSRVSSSSGASDTEPSRLGESPTRNSPRLPTNARLSGTKTRNLGENGNDFHRSSRDSITSDYDDVTYEWVKENFHKHGSVKKNAKSNK